jgi:ring-1,2-phenylacetyl-CoA epoxidase subunit PaaE
MSIIKHDLGSNPDTRFQLFYINKSLNSVILKEELEALKNNHLNRFEIYYFFTREKRDIELYNGRIDKNKLDILSEKIIDLKQLDNIYLCGPKAMIFDLKGYFHNKGIDKNKIHFELFYTGDEPSTEQFISHQKQNGQDFEITLKEGGKSFDYTIASGTTLLDGALQHQANLPFACKGGVCATCRTKLVEGEVEMIQNYALEKDEIDAGYILACQSLPISKHIVIDFDQ